MMTSKSFRAVLPSLDDDELERLREWSAENCAASAVFREDDAVIWLASKDRARSREAFLSALSAQHPQAACGRSLPAQGSLAALDG